MADGLRGMKVAILATDGVERIELEQPRGALYGAGASSELLSIHAGTEEFVIDGQFMSSRSPADLPAFCPAIVAQFAEASVPGSAPGGMR
jgi:putative intracellular protease/amidase